MRQAEVSEAGRGLPAWLELRLPRAGRRVLTFAEVETERVRIDVQETNGGRSARVYEVRLYGEAG